ncbi:MAG: PDZ domain-containing protein [Pirellulaceae bacterium]|nr:PDZ domain-containing protein [Pirellulaceae bacterium]
MLDVLFFIPDKIAGLPVFGVGLLLAAWCVFGAILLIVTARRGGLGGEFWGYVPLLALVAAALVWFLPRMCVEGRGLPIRGYGTMLLIAVVAGTTLFAWRSRRYGYNPDTMVSLVFWMFVPGIVGARLFFVIQYWRDFAKPDRSPAEVIAAILSFSEGGLVVYGSLIGGLIGMVVFVRKHRLPVLAICDLLTPGLLLGLALGRVGCLAHGCCFGGPCDLPWAITFPEDSPVYERQLARGQLWGFTLPGDRKAAPVVASVEPDGAADKAGLRPGDRITRVNGRIVRAVGDVSEPMHVAVVEDVPIVLDTAKGRRATLQTHPMPPRSLPVHPTQIYSAINATVLCLFLLAYWPFRRRDGEVFALMLTLYPITRFLLEAIRTDEGASLGTSLSISQNISLIALAGVVVLWVYVLKQPRGTVLTPVLRDP